MMMIGPILAVRTSVSPELSWYVRFLIRTACMHVRRTCLSAARFLYGTDGRHTHNLSLILPSFPLIMHAWSSQQRSLYAVHVRAPPLANTYPSLQEMQISKYHVRYTP